MERDELDKLVYRVIGCMIAVHRELGPGLNEHSYRRALMIELTDQGIGWETEKDVELFYKGRSIGMQRLDLFIEDELVIELKTVEALNKKHYAQLRSYLKAVRKPLGLLANFAEYQLDARRVELRVSPPSTD